MIEDLHVPKAARLLVSFVRGSPFLSMLLGLVVLVGLGSGLPRNKADFTHRGFFYADDPLILAFDAFERRFGNDDAVVIAVHSPSGIFDKESITLLQELTEKMWLMPEVIRVDSLTNYNWVHAEGDDLLVEPLIPDDEPVTDAILAERKNVALTHEILPDYLISRDAKTALLFAAIKPGIDAPPDAPKITAAARDLKAEFTRGDHVVHLTGGPPINNAFGEASQVDLQRLVPLTVALVILLLGILLRSVLGIVLSLTVVFLSIAGTLGLAGWLGIELTNITSIMPQILIAIGVADSVHILVTFFRTMARGVDRKEAAEYALLKNFQPTLVTAITTACGFFTFVTADLKPIAGLGVLAGAGTLFAWFLTYHILGAALFLLPLKAKQLSESNRDRSERRAERIADNLIRFRAPIIAVFSMVCIAAAVLSTQNTVNSDPFKYFRDGYPIRVANEFIEDQVGGARGVELVVDSAEDEGIKDPAFMRKVESLQQWVDTLPDVTRTVSIVDILKQTHRSLNGGKNEFYRLPDSREAIAQEIFLYTMSLPQGMNINDRVTVKNDAVRVTVFWTIKTSTEVMQTIHRIEAKAKEMGLNVSATGKNRLYQSMNGYVVHSFVVSLTAAVLLISLILIVFFGSLKLGLLAMLPNAVPLVIGGGILFLIGKPLDVGVVLVMAVCLGIAVDDTIHILSNFSRLKKQGLDQRAAIEDVISHTGPALIVTTLVLVSSFGSFVLGTFTPNVYFGLMVSIILTVALFTDLIFLPAILLKGKGEQPVRG